MDIERDALDVLHCKVSVSVPADAALEHGHDVRMVQAGRQLDFSLEATKLPDRRKRAAQQDLQRNGSLRGLLNRAINDALPAAVDLGKDLVAFDCLRRGLSDGDDRITRERDR